MSITIAVPAETAKGELRVAMVPEVVSRLQQLGAKIVIQSGAGSAAHYLDDNYSEAGAMVIDNPDELYTQADIVLCVQAPTLEQIKQYSNNTTVIGFLNPHNNLDLIREMCARKITSLAMEMVPRSSRAQAMDALSSQRSIIGYKAVIIAADLLGKFFPMLTTPTGTLRPATVLIVGAGVAGLQAIATARRLGAIVEAQDVRGATKEQVESLGAKFISVSVSAETQGGYARELNDEEKRMQEDLLAKHVAKADVVITTAAIPGRPSPKIIRKEMVDKMKPGSVIVDIAAEGGGNTEVTQPGETIVHNNVIIHGPLNVASQAATHASDMYAKNMLNMLKLMIHDGNYTPNWEDEILRDSTVTRDGEITHESIRTQVLGEHS